MEQLDIRDYEFSEEEILNELNRLGYHNVPRSKLKEFQRDLKVLIQNDKSSSVNDSWTSAYSKSPDTESSPPIHIKIGQSNGRDKREDLNKGYTRAQSSMGYHIHEAKSPILSGDLSDTDSELPRMVKRKTMRKNDKGARFIDESMTESDAGSVIDAHERLQRMRLKDFDDLPTRSSRCTHRDEEEPPYRLSDDDPRPASVILRPTTNPHTKNLRKSDPVARYQQFKEVWQSHRAPGERDHKNLRWNIRERMLAQEVPEKKTHRVYVQNKYVIPSEKQRKSLRWQVRTEMAQGIKPACGFFHEF